ncbi:MAG: TIGR04255 family protein [Gemmatimonadales bacterium]|nr:TIGR04255 family protein [Gemmatimonadales bacterium]
MSEQEYSSPPVHEVVLDLLFREREADDRVFERIQHAIASVYNQVSALEENQIQVIATPGAPSEAASTTRTVGWMGTNVVGEARWLLRCRSQRLTLNMVRSASWPSGPYVGWPVIRAEFAKCLELLADEFKDLPVQRAGLRYLNKLALPSTGALATWLNVGIRAPEVLSGLSVFNCRQGWTEIQGHSGLSALVNLARIKVEDPSSPPDAVGVLLDIDVYTRDPSTAPTYARVSDWFNHAHAAERLVFESSISNEIRSTLGAIQNA